MYKLTTGGIQQEVHIIGVHYLYNSIADTKWKAYE